MSLREALGLCVIQENTAKQKSVTLSDILDDTATQFKLFLSEPNADNFKDVVYAMVSLQRKFDSYGGNNTNRYSVESNDWFKHNPELEYQGELELDLTNWDGQENS